MVFWCRYGWLLVGHCVFLSNVLVQLHQGGTLVPTLGALHSVGSLQVLHETLLVVNLLATLGACDVGVRSNTYVRAMEGSE